jgi:PAS domain S-box-containing protein
MRERRFPTNLFDIAILAAVYFVAGKLGLSLAVVNPSVTAAWPPTGIALAALLLLGYRVWPGILLGAFLVNVTTADSIAASVFIAAGNTLEGLVGAYLVNRFAGGRHAFARAPDILRFAVLAGAFSTALGATVGVTSLLLAGLASWTDFVPIWLTWWLGDAVGAVVVAPFLILWSSDVDWAQYRERIFEIVCLILGLVFVGQLIFGMWPSSTGRQTPAFLCLPFFVWAATRFGQRGAATAAFLYLLTAMAIWGTASGGGPPVMGTQHESVLWWQVFVGLTAVMTIALAAVVSELQLMRTSLEQRVQERTKELSSTVDTLHTEIEEHEQAEKKFRSLLESAPDAVVVVDHRGRIALINVQTEMLFGYTRDELLGQPVEILIPEPYRSRHRKHRQGYNASPRARPMGAGQDLLGLRKDGTKFPVEISLSPLGGEEGTLVFTAIRDISERKQAEMHMRKLSSDLLRIQDEERRRIARELHDRLVQDMASALMDLSIVQQSLPKNSEQATRALAEAGSLTQSCIRELRTLSYLLHPPLLDEMGVGFALRQYVEGFSVRSGIQIELQIADDLGRLPGDIELCLFAWLRKPDEYSPALRQRDRERSHHARSRSSRS